MVRNRGPFGVRKQPESPFLTEAVSTVLTGTAFSLPLDKLNPFKFDT